MPNGTLFGDGVCARIKQELLKEFNLHTIVRLPNGVFAPYTSIPTNLLFFDRSGPTKDIWYYEQPLPEGRKNYTKTKPHPVRGVRRLPEVVEQAQGKRPGMEGQGGGCHQADDDGNWLVNLDIKNPSAEEALEHLPPEQLVESIVAKEKRILEIMGEIKALLAEGPNVRRQRSKAIIPQPVGQLARNSAAGLPRGYVALLEDIKSRIRTARSKASLSVNRGLIELYWSIGRATHLARQRGGLGSGRHQPIGHGHSDGVSRNRGIFPDQRIAAMPFHLAWVDGPAISAQPVPNLRTSISAQAVPKYKRTSLPPSVVMEIPWGHNIALVFQLTDPAQRLWYAPQDYCQRVVPQRSSIGSNRTCTSRRQVDG